MVKKLSCMCGASLAEYVDTGNRDEKFLANIFCMKMFHVQQKFYAIVCIYCGVGGTQRTLN